MRISDWSSDVCSSDLAIRTTRHRPKLSAPRPTPDRVDVVSMHAQAATQWRLRIDAALERTLPAADEPPRRLHAAMRHAALLGGKRMRPLLVYATGTAFGADIDAEIGRAHV